MILYMSAVVNHFFYSFALSTEKKNLYKMIWDQDTYSPKKRFLEKKVNSPQGVC